MAAHRSPDRIRSDLASLERGRMPLAGAIRLVAASRAIAAGDCGIPFPEDDADLHRLPICEWVVSGLSLTDRAAHPCTLRRIPDVILNMLLGQAGKAGGALVG